MTVGAFRIAWRVPTLAVLTAVMYAYLLVTSFVLGLVRGGGWDGPATAHWRSALFHRWSRVASAIIGISATVHGRPPESSFFLVTNHLSYVDILVLASRLTCVFVARGDVAGWPVVGSLCRSADTLFIDRTNKRDIPRVQAEIKRVLGDRRGVVVFPEGTSTKGAEVGRFRPSLLEAAAVSGIPVSYAALSYRTPEGSVPAHLSVCWWGEMTFGGHFLDLLALPGVEASVSFGDEPIRENDRKLLARRLQCAVEQRFQPVV